MDKKQEKDELLQELKLLKTQICQLKDIENGKKRAQKVLHESLELYHTLVEISPEAIILLDLSGKIIMANDQALEIYGIKDLEIILGKSAFEIIAPKDRERAITNLRKTLQSPLRNNEYLIVNGLGKYLSVEINSSVIKNKKDAPIAFMIVLRDISHRKQVEEELRYKNAFKTVITELSAKFVDLSDSNFEDGINDALRQLGEFADIDRCYIFLFSDNNKTMNNTHEWCAAGVEPQIHRLKQISINSFPWIINQIKSMSVVYISSLADLPEQAQAEKIEWEKEGICSLINVPMTYQGKVIGFLGFDSVREEKNWSEDINVLLKVVADMFANVISRRQMYRDIKSLNKELLKMNMRLKQLALRDALTNLYNHRYFEEAIEAEFMRAKRHALPLSVIMLDVDYFKSINDVYGHQFGDLVLKQFADQLTQMVRKYDTVIRYGGEEFIIITPGADKDIVLVLAQRLLEIVKLYTFGNKTHKVKLKISVAVACFPDDKIHKASDFIKLSDRILDKVKETGGDKVYSYQDIVGTRQIPAVDLEKGTDVVALQDKLGKLTKRANQSLAEAIFAFAKTIEIKDHYTGEHVEKTVHYATELAKAKNLPKDEVEKIRQASILHDLGKIGISEKILMKKSKLTAQEYEEIKKHPQIGADILRPIHFFQAIIPLMLHHHERWDGKGYPYALKGEEIPLGARIIALADTYEALTANRRYRKACSKKMAIKIIKDVSGTQFDPVLVDLFMIILEKEQG
ncbi:MAG: diguanylate cyclase [Candidatus Omnitrophica bacterium]|nr:diguanylate cyclase [Candidatus Omnitrophota bacterium]